MLAGMITLVMPFSALANHSSGEPTAADVPQEEHCVLTDNLSLGARGAQVECLQGELHEAGYLSDAAITGYFGMITKQALSKWQSERNIAANGYFGPISRAALASHATPVAASHPAYKALEESHKAMMAAFMSTSTGMAMDMHDDRKTIAVVLYNEFEPLDAIGPLEVLGQLTGYKVVTVAKQKGEVASAFGTKMVADYSFDELKNPAIIVVPGGLFGTIAASKDPATLAWLRAADKTSEYTTSVCTGAWILAAAGLLDGRQASTHWTGADYLEDFGVKYTGKRYTVDGKYVTAAGVSAGIDMGFKLIAMIEGEDRAKIAQVGLEYDPQPPFDAGSPAKSDPELVKIMRDMMTDHIKAAQIMFATTTTTMPATMVMGADTHAAGADMHMHTGLNVASWAQTPSVKLVVHEDSMGGWNLEIQPQNFRFAPEHVGGAVVANEGHAHLYLDGAKIARVYGNWFNLSAAAVKGSGVHQLRVTLNANDHSDLELNGAPIESVATVVVK
jgi:putative intracellular protease/amidase